MSFKILLVAILAVTISYSARVHEASARGGQGLSFMKDVVKEVERDPQVAALIQGGKTNSKEFEKLIDKKTLEIIKGNPTYRKGFTKGFLQGNPFGQSLTKEEANKVADFLLSDPSLLNKSKDEFNRAAAAALPDIDKKWKEFSAKQRRD